MDMIMQHSTLNKPVVLPLVAKDAIDAYFIPARPGAITSLRHYSALELMYGYYTAE